MKKIISSVLLVACTLIGYAQTKEPQAPKELTDQSTTTRLAKDLNTRNAMTANQPISWWDAGYGYYGTYMLDSTTYMTRYDRQGNYIETLTKREWNNSVPVPVTSAFSQSPYKTYEVTSYWEVTDPNRKGYYFELNHDGKEQRVWMNDKHAFSTTPYKTPPSKPVN
jgi:hypothetical protein